MKNLLIMILTASSTGLVACEAPGEEAFTESLQETASDAVPCDWPQVFGTSDHAGRACPEISNLEKTDEIVADGDVGLELAASGFLQNHEGFAVTLGNWVVFPTQDGVTLDEDGSLVQSTVRHHVSAWRWQPSVLAFNRQLVHAWDQDTDFQTVDGAVATSITSGYVQQLGVALSERQGGSVWVPGAGGTLLRLSLTTGAILARVNPFAGTILDGDPRLTVNSPPMIRPNGDVYYTAVAWSTAASPLFQPPRGSWIVRVHEGAAALRDWSPDSAIRLAPGADVVASPSVGVPTLNSLCVRAFGTGGTPAPTGPDSQPPLFRCGVQRPAVNAAVAYSSATGRLVVFSYSNNAGDGRLIELDPDTMAPILAADVQRNSLRYGCGVRFVNDAFPTCDALTAGGTVNLGADPNFNGNGHLRLPTDIDDNSPSIGPDGTMGICGYDGGFSFERQIIGDPFGFDARGACVTFNADGTHRADNPNFGWEVTLTARCTAPLCSGFSWLQDDSRYSLLDLGMDQLTPDFTIQARTVIPPEVFGDFVDTHVPFGPRGDHYGVSEAGILYKMNATGQVVESVALTPEPVEVLSGHIARDRAGDLIVTYAGRVHVVRTGHAPGGRPLARPLTSRMMAAKAAKARAATRVPEPPAL